MKKAGLFSVVLISALISVSCSSSGTTPVSTTTDLSDNMGAVPVGNSLRYTFSAPVTASTVDTTTFFLVQAGATSNIAATTAGLKATYNAAVCDGNTPASATVSCGSATQCSLYPAASMTAGTV